MIQELFISLWERLARAWHVNADAWGGWLCATRFAPPCSAKQALLSERISNDLRSALQVDSQMHMLMSWLMSSWKSRKPPSVTEKEYMWAQIRLPNPSITHLPQTSFAWHTADNCKMTAVARARDPNGHHCVTLVEQPLVHMCWSPLRVCFPAPLQLSFLHLYFMPVNKTKVEM